MTITINRVSRDEGAHSEIVDKNIIFAIKNMAEDILYLYDAPPNRDSQPEEVAVYREIQEIKPYLEKITRGEKTHIFFGTLMDLFDMVHDLQLHIVLPLDEYKRIFSNYALLSKKFPLPTELPSTIYKPKLSDHAVSFDEKIPAIVWGAKKCGLPPSQNEFDLARVMFKKPIDESTDWSLIHLEITGNSEVIGDEKERKSVMDTVNRTNKRLQKNFGVTDKLYTWKDKTISRNH